MNESLHVPKITNQGISRTNMKHHEHTCRGHARSGPAAPARCLEPPAQHGQMMTNHNLGIRNHHARVATRLRGASPRVHQSASLDVSAYLSISIFARVQLSRCVFRYLGPWPCLPSHNPPSLYSPLSISVPSSIRTHVCLYIHPCFDPTKSESLLLPLSDESYPGAAASAPRTLARRKPSRLFRVMDKTSA